MDVGVLAAILVTLFGGPISHSVLDRPAAIARQSSKAAPKDTGAADQPDAPLEVDATIDLFRSGGAQWWQVTPSATYTINPRWSVEFGLPFYAVNGALTGDGASHAGVGDVYGGISLDASSDAVTFYSTLSGAAPTGSYANGLGAGTATFDWTNHVEVERGRLAPYADAGFANSLNTGMRNSRNGPGGTAGRPVVSVGSFFQAEGGVEVGLRASLSTSLSAYIVHPLSNAQTAAVPRRGPPRLLPGTPGSLAVTDLDRDHGFSATLSSSLTASLDVSAWFWRSLRFHYNTMSVSLNINISALMTKTAADNSAPKPR